MVFEKIESIKIKEVYEKPDFAFEKNCLVCACDIYTDHVKTDELGLPIFAFFDLSLRAPPPPFLIVYSIYLYLQQKTEKKKA